MTSYVIMEETVGGLYEPTFFFSRSNFKEAKKVLDDLQTEFDDPLRLYVECEID